RAQHCLTGADAAPLEVRIAEFLLLIHRHRHMAVRQRLSLEYLLAWAAERQDDLHGAIEHLDTTLDLAESLRDQPGYSELAWRAGTASHQLGYYADAHHYYSIALTALRALNPTLRQGDSVSTRLELDLVLRLASVEFELTAFPAAARRLEDATALLRPLGPSARMQAASLDWIHAVLCRWQGEHALALQAAVRAADDLEQLAAPDLLARIQLVVVDIALDMVERFPYSSTSLAHTSHLALAQPYVHSALQLTRRAGDPAGEGMARLALHRWQRLESRAINGVAAVEAVARAATMEENMGLLGRAQTALGDEFMLQGEREAALTCYRSAREILERHKFRALAIWPQRALLSASELAVPYGALP